MIKLNEKKLNENEKYFSDIIDEKILLFQENNNNNNNENNFLDFKIEIETIPFGKFEIENLIEEEKEKNEERKERIY